MGLTTDPAPLIFGRKAMLFFPLKPGESIEPSIGVRAHLLAASNDLIVLTLPPRWRPEI